MSREDPGCSGKSKPYEPLTGPYPHDTVPVTPYCSYSFLEMQPMNLMIRSVMVPIAAMVLLLALPAPAYAAFSDAPNGKMTLFENDSYGGFFLSRINVDTTFRNDFCNCDLFVEDAGNFSDDASSLRNRTDDWWILYEDSQLSGPRLCVAPRANDANIGGGDDPTDFEDEISSMERSGPTKPNNCADTIVVG